MFQGYYLFMSEQPFEEMKSLATIFVDQYNINNGSNFQWSDERSYQPGEPYDFKLFQGTGELGVQVVRAVADQVREFINPKKAAAIIEPLRIELEKSRLPAIFISINFHNLPQNKKGEENVIFWLQEFIRHKARISSSGSYFSYSDDDDCYMEHIKKHVSDINIMPHPNTEAGIGVVTFGYSESEKIPESWPNDEMRVITAVAKKENIDPNVIILVDSGTFPVDDFYLPLIKDGIFVSKRKEIWLVDNFTSRKRAIRIK